MCVGGGGIIRSNTLHCMLEMCTGFVSNGEFNELRCTGYTRPLSVLKIKADVRAKFARMRVPKMQRMITPISK